MNEKYFISLSLSQYHHHVGGGVFSLRGVGQGEGGSTITFTNIVVEDPRPTHMHFKIMMTALPPWGDPEERTRGPGDVYGITFQVSKGKCAK